MLCIEAWFQAFAPKSNQFGVTPVITVKDICEGGVHCKRFSVGASMLREERMPK